MRSTDRRRRGASGPRPQPTVDDGNNDLRAGANQALYLENMQPPGARGVAALGRFCICVFGVAVAIAPTDALVAAGAKRPISEEHTSELQSRGQLVCLLLIEKPERLFEC